MRPIAPTYTTIAAVSGVGAVLAAFGVVARYKPTKGFILVGLIALQALPREELRDPNKSYNVVTLDAANAVTPAFDWRAFFTSIGVNDTKDFSLSHPKYFAAMQRELAETPVKDWQAYLRWQDREANQKFFAGEHAAFSQEAAGLLMEAGIIKALPDMSRLADTRFIK